MPDHDHLQAAVDALRADAAKSEVAGVEVVRTLARRAFHVDMTYINTSVYKYLWEL